MKITQSVNGIVEEREATPEEEKAILAAQKEGQDNYEAEQTKKADKELKKEALYAKLGITAEEAALLLG
jgi:hypothetical protein